MAIESGAAEGLREQAIAEKAVDATVRDLGIVSRIVGQFIPVFQQLTRCVEKRECAYQSHDPCNGHGPISNPKITPDDKTVEQHSPNESPSCRGFISLFRFPPK